MIKPITIGNVKIENNIFLAPMAGITDLPFRIICKDFGAGLVYTEMASSKAIHYKDEKTKCLLDTKTEKRPVVAQLFGSDPQIMAEAAAYISEKNIVDILDINMGCPAPKITKNGEGSALLEKPELVEAIVKETVAKSSIPVTVKIRKTAKENQDTIEIAKKIEQAGASAITVHGRTRAEFFTGNVDLEIIKKVKESVKIPVIGNGDIKSREDAINMFKYTGCDAVMIGRGAIGHPWIFQEIINENNLSFSIREVILKHINMLCDYKGERVAVKEMRHHIAYYLKGLPNASEIRNEVNTINTKQELIGCLIEYFDTI